MNFDILLNLIVFANQFFYCALFKHVEHIAFWIKVGRINVHYLVVILLFKYVIIDIMSVLGKLLL